MKPSAKYSGLDREFWAHVRLVSELLGYSDKSKGEKKLRRYQLPEIVRRLEQRKLGTEHLWNPVTHEPTQFGSALLSYLSYRADLIENQIRDNLMDRDEAKAHFEELRAKLNPTCNLPMNKQKGEKRHHLYLTCIVNMLTEHALGGKYFDDTPRGFTVITEEGRPLRTLSRWMDGAYPSRINPIAVWETKEYYGTTTFGSRVADGVYEAMLDGEELGELYDAEQRKVLHYLIVDDRFTWWDCGRSYLCRIVDMLHMGLLDEAVFGREALERWPQIVKSWPHPK